MYFLPSDKRQASHSHASLILSMARLSFFVGLPFAALFAAALRHDDANQARHAEEEGKECHRNQPQVQGYEEIPHGAKSYHGA